jgi:hypothetical protein
MLVNPLGEYSLFLFQGRTKTVFFDTCASYPLAILGRISREVLFTRGVDFDVPDKGITANVRMTPVLEEYLQ